MRGRLARLLIADKKTNIHRRRINLLASLATHSNGNDCGAIGGEAGDFLLSLFALGRRAGRNLGARLFRFAPT